jgi:hypothetical protein
MGRQAKNNNPHIFIFKPNSNCMIFYGTKSKLVATEQLPGKCQNCETANSVTMHVFQKYAHVFWIPFFPLGKYGVTECSHCKQVLRQKEMPSAMTASYETLKGQTKTPRWMFAGLLLTAVLITAGVIASKQNDERNAQLILTPQSGDVFEIKGKDDRYTLYKVAGVQGDSVFVQVNKYEVTRSSGLAELKRKEGNSYADEQLGFTRAELKQMLSSGEILNIDRK